MRTFEPPWDRPNTTEHDEEVARAQQQVRAVPGPLACTQTLEVVAEVPKSQGRAAEAQGADGVREGGPSSMQLMGDAQVLVVEPPQQQQEEPQEEPQVEPDERVVADASGDTDDANAGAGVAVEDGARGDEDGEGDAYDDLGPSISARGRAASAVDDADALVQFVAEQLEEEQCGHDADADADAEAGVGDGDNLVATVDKEPSDAGAGAGADASADE